MTFLQPWVLWGLPLILVPVIIHLLNRLRYRSQSWAAMSFLLAATRTSTSRARIRHLLILICRVLAILLLVLLLGRPLSGGWLGGFLAGAPDAIVILLDRSASMETRAAPDAPTFREQVLTSLAQSAQPFRGVSRLVFIEHVTKEPEHIDNPALLTEHPLARPTDTAADIPSLLQSAVNWILENRPGATELWLASDLQRANWVPEDARWHTLRAQIGALPQKVRIRLLNPGSPASDNVALGWHDAVRRPGTNHQSWQLTVDFERSTVAAHTVPVTINLQGSRSQFDARLESSSTRWRQVVQLPASEEDGWGMLELPQDANARDNRVYFIFGTDALASAVVVGTDHLTERALQWGASAWRTNRYEPAKRFGTDSWELALAENPAMILWQAPLPAGDQGLRLSEYVRRGGVLLILPSTDQDRSSIEGVTWGEWVNHKADAPMQLGRWDQDQGPLAKTDDGLALPLEDVLIFRHRSQQGGGAVLASLKDGSPFLTRTILGKGEIHWLATLPNPEWSNLGDGPVLVPMLQRLLQIGARRLRSTAYLDCGAITDLEEARRWKCIDSPGHKDIRWDAGIYQSGNKVAAVNRPALENEPVYLEAATVAELLQGLPFAALNQTRTAREDMQSELWRTLLFAMLAALLVEAALILPSGWRPNPTRKQPASARPPAAAPSSTAVGIPS